MLHYQAPITFSTSCFSSPNFDPKNVADALVTTIDGITQRKTRLEKAELENQTKAQAIKLAKQKAARG